MEAKVLLVLILLCLCSMLLAGGAGGAYINLQPATASTRATDGYWTEGEWSECNGGVRTRDIYCDYDKCLGDKPSKSAPCIGKWKDSGWSKCRANEKTTRTFTCDEGYHCPEQDGNITTYTLSEKCDVNWNRGPWTKCKDGKRIRTVECPENRICRNSRPKSTEKCWAMWSKGEWSDCKDGKQTRVMSCPDGHHCTDRGGNVTTYTQSIPCYKSNIKYNKNCPTDGCLDKAKIKVNNKDCLERTSTGIDVKPCSDNNSQFFKYNKDTQQFKTYDDKCIDVNEYNVLTVDDCNKNNYSQRFIQTNDGKTSVLKNGKYIQSQRDGKYLNKEFRDSFVTGSDGMQSNFAYTDKGAWKEGEWSSCDNGEETQARMIICDDTKCDPRDRNTSTFEETRKCFEKGQLKSSKNYKTKCIERKDNDRGYSISDCHPQTDQKYFKFIPYKGLIKSHDNKCADMSQKDPYGRNQMLTFQICDENKKEQKFKYDKNKFIHYNDKYIQTNIGWAEESRSINDPVNKWFDHLLKLS